MRERPYQAYSIDAALAAMQKPENNRSTMLIAPTGAGKTFMLSKVTDEMIKIMGGKPRILVLVHRNKVNEQNKAAFDAVCGKKSSIFAGDNKSLSGQVVFGMVQTIAGLYKKLPAFDMIVVDEFHHAAADSYIDIIEDQRKKNSNLYLFGVTATPNRGDKKGLVRVTNNFCAQILIQDLVELGYLVPLKFKSIRMFKEDEISSVSKPDFYEETTKRLIKELKGVLHERRKIVLFAGSQEQMAYIERELNNNLINAVSIHSEMSDSDIKKNTRLFEKSDVKVLLNIDIATEGYDYQPVDCVVLMRKVGNKGYYSQMVGRGLRTIDPNKFPGIFKKDCLLIDFGGNAERYGSLYEKVDLVGKDVFLPCSREMKAKEDNKDEEKEAPQIIDKVNKAILHGRGVFESFCFDGGYVKGISGKGKSLFIVEDKIYLKKGNFLCFLSNEDEAIEAIDYVIGEDEEYFEELKNRPIEPYQIKLLLNKFDIVGCSKYRASVLINFLVVRGKLCV